ncbi:HEAT repeat domain-containing protein [Tautonia rosea]|uniref:HEAT repeat domain-containing protein n=1 Tax=Tautonia rosea TaxID=2728037 RepID=UPI001472A844|nr:HEAT repeat domain-containing protein [Tautonia rosea]
MKIRGSEGHGAAGPRWVVKGLSGTLLLLLMSPGCGPSDPASKGLGGLSAGNPESRREAAAAMGYWDDSGEAAKAVGPLASALANDEDAGVRAASARSLGQLIRRHRIADVGEAVAALTTGMNDPDPEVRHASAVAMFGIGERPEGIAPALVAALRSSTMSVRDDADVALSELPITDPEHLETMLLGLDDESEVVRRASQMGLTMAPLDLDPESGAEAVTRAMDRDDDPEDRALLAAVLGRFPSTTSTARETLIAALADAPEGEVRAAAATALRPFAADDPGAAEALRTATAEDDAKDVRVASAAALADPSRSTEEARQTLLDAIKAGVSDETQSAELAEAIASEEGEGASLLIERLASDDPMIRAFSARGLGVVSPRTEGAREAITALIATLDDPEAEVRIASADALSRFGPAAISASSALARLAEGDQDLRVSAHAAAAIPIVDPPPTR